MLPPYGVVPSEIDEFYPLSQTEIAFPLSDETRRYVTDRSVEYVLQEKYAHIVLLADTAIWGNELVHRFRQLKNKTRKNIVIVMRDNDVSDKTAASNVLKHLQRTRT